MDPGVIAKYFAHGMVFSLISVVLFFPLLTVMLMLVMFGSIIGLLIGIGLLFLIVGFINGGLGSFFWEIDRGEGLMNTLIHGLVLEIIFLLVSLATFYLPTLLFPGIVTQFVAFIITAPIDGAVGKEVASWFASEAWKTGYEDLEAREAVPSGISYTQPAPTEISEALPICPICQDKTEWRANYSHGEGFKPYNIMCSVCHAEWEVVLSKPMIPGVMGTPMPEHLSPLEDILVLRNRGESSWARIYLNREIYISAWKEMIKKTESTSRHPSQGRGARRQNAKQNIPFYKY